jgi:hypothetical protein
MPYKRDARNNAQRRNDVNAMGDRYGSLESSLSISEAFYTVQE